jgi:hypothetical protein
LVYCLDRKGVSGMFFSMLYLVDILGTVGCAAMAIYAVIRQRPVIQWLWRLVFINLIYLAITGISLLF